MLAQLQGKNMIGSPSSNSSSLFSGLGADSGLGASTPSGREQLQRARSSSSAGSGSNQNHADSILLQPSSPRDSFIHQPFNDSVSTSSVDFPSLQGFPPIFGSDLSGSSRTLSPDSLLLGNSNNEAAPTRSSSTTSTFPPQFGSTSTSLFDLNPPINPSTWFPSGAPIGYSHHTTPLNSSPNVSANGFGLDDPLRGLGSIPMSLPNDTGGWVPDSTRPSTSNEYGDMRVRASTGTDVDLTPEGRRTL